MNLRRLVGSGDKIGLVMLPVLVVGLFLNLAYPSFFDVGGPRTGERPDSGDFPGQDDILRSAV